MARSPEQSDVLSYLLQCASVRQSQGTSHANLERVASHHLQTISCIVLQFLNEHVGSGVAAKESRASMETSSNQRRLRPSVSCDQKAHCGARLRTNPACRKHGIMPAPAFPGAICQAVCSAHRRSFDIVVESAWIRLQAVRLPHVRSFTKGCEGYN